MLLLLDKYVTILYTFSTLSCAVDSRLSQHSTRDTAKLECNGF